MAKYLTKDILDSRLKGHRILMTSHDLVRPSVFINEETDIFYRNYAILKTVGVVTTPTKKILNLEIKKYGNSNTSKNHRKNLKNLLL